MERNGKWFDTQNFKKEVNVLKPIFDFWLVLGGSGSHLSGCLWLFYLNILVDGGDLRMLFCHCVSEILSSQYYY